MSIESSLIPAGSPSWSTSQRPLRSIVSKGKTKVADLVTIYPLRPLGISFLLGLYLYVVNASNISLYGSEQSVRTAWDP